MSAAPSSTAVRSGTRPPGSGAGVLSGVDLAIENVVETMPVRYRQPDATTIAHARWGDLPPTADDRADGHRDLGARSLSLDPLMSWSDEAGEWLILISGFWVGAICWFAQLSCVLRSGLSAVGQTVVGSGGEPPMVLRHSASHACAQGQWLGRCRTGRRCGRVRRAAMLTISRRRGNELSDYLTESGNIDPEKVNADAAVILAERPGLRRSQPPIDPTQGHGPTLILRRASRGQRRFHRVPRNPQYPRYLRNRQLLQPAQPPDLCSVLHAQHSLPPWLAQPRLSRKLVKIELPRSGAVVSIQLPPTTR